MHKMVVGLAVASWLLIVCGSRPADAASRIVVPRDYPTIQAAVDAAAPGDTINVKSGTYMEEVVIGKDVTLKGAGVRATIIRSPATLTTYASDAHNGTPFSAIVRVAHGAHVRMLGLTVSGPVPCGFVTGIVAVQSANLELTDARISDMLPNTMACSVATDRSVQFGLGDRALIDGELGTTASGRVTGVVIDGYQDEALVAVGPFGVPPTSVTFADNVIIGGAPQVPVDQVGIDVFLNAVATVTGNTVSGGLCTFPECGPDPVNDFQAIGIFVGPGGDGSRISDNHVSGSDIGIAQLASPNCCTISKNTLKDNRYFGIVIFDGDGRTRENTVTGGQVGIGVFAIDADTVAVLHGDKIRQTSVAPVQEIECCGFTATVIQDKK
jgi:parallel beta-helix repeat protein